MNDGTAPRQCAAEAYIRVLSQGRTLEHALETLPAHKALEARDRAFARYILATSFRRLGQTHAVLSAFLTKPLEETAPYARALLITGATQILWMDIPPHAVVSSAVKLAEQRPETRKLKGMINAVLRNVDRTGRQKAKMLPPQDNLPEWLRTSWRKNFGPAAMNRMILAGLETPPLDLTVKDPARREHWAAELGARILPTGSLRLDKIGDVTALPGYDEGAWWAQDAAAAIPAQLLKLPAGSNVIDMCAAPGGKTLQLTAAGYQVQAVDSSDPRLKRVRANLQRTGLEAEIHSGDGRKWKPREQVDGVLLDAPCSATGTFRRHPESNWIKDAGDPRKFGKIQRELARAVAKMIKPGGQLVVCTCSLQIEEGELLSGDIQKNIKTLQLDPIAPEEIPGLEDALTKRGELRLTPALWNDVGSMDGFFIARFRKSG